MKLIVFEKLRGFAITSLLVSVFVSVWSQQNLIRNHSFENGTGNPSTVAQLDKCNRWKTYETLGPGGPATSDWFKGTPNGFQGTVSCHLSSDNTFNLWPFVPPNDGVHYAGMVKWKHDLEGEGVQQRLSQTLTSGYYYLDFDYLLSCDTMTYELEIYLGVGINHCSYLAATIPLPTTNIGQWQNIVRQILIPNSFNNQLDWFIVLNTSPYGYTGPGSYSPYIYVDDFHLYKLPCTDCDPNGLISYNANILNFFSPNNDGVLDQWCVQNINNVSWYDMQIFNSNGVRERRIQGSDANGFENFSICWNGRDDQGQAIPNYSTFYVVTTLGNCGTQYTWLDSVFLMPSPVWDTTVHPVTIYVPPLFGLETPPTHYQNLHLYGGIYWGNHDWYACDAIWLDGSGAPRVPYFIAGYTANLGMYSTNGTYIELGSTDFQLGSDVDINPQPVQCCPQLRLANPELPSTEVDSIGELSTSEDPVDTEEGDSRASTNEGDEFTLHVHPNPVTDVLYIDFHLPARNFIKARLINASGITVSEVLHPSTLEAGDHSYSISSKSIPNGLYFLQLSQDSGTVTVKVVVQR